MIAFVFLILFLDALSKFWINNNLPLMAYSIPIYPYGGIGVFKDFFGIEFSLVHATNTGAAWSIFSDHSAFLFYLRIVLVIGLIYFYFMEKSPQLKLPIAFIIAGALGNILDIFFYGHVIDMFYFIFWGYSYPVFNIADSAICIGVFLYIVLSWNISRASKATIK